MPTPSWISQTQEFFRSQLGSDESSAEDEASLSAAVERTEEAVSSMDEVDLGGNEHLSMPRCSASNAYEIATQLLNSWHADLENSFFVDIAEAEEIVETREYIEHNPIILASAFGAPIAMLSRWSMSSHETMLPLGRGEDILLNCSAVNTFANETRVEKRAVYELVVPEAIAAHLLLGEATYADLVHRLWVRALSNDGVDQNLLLGTAVRPIPALRGGVWGGVS